MAGLLDIATRERKVTIGDNEVVVRGIGSRGLVMLFERFPELQRVFTGRLRGMDDAAIMKMGVTLISDGVPAIIAAGLGHPGEQEYEEAADLLGLEDQTDLLTAIRDLTMPSGLGPFMEKLRGLGLLPAAPPEVPATKSPKQSKS